MQCTHSPTHNVTGTVQLQTSRTRFRPVPPGSYFKSPFSNVDSHQEPIELFQNPFVGVLDGKESLHYG